MPERATDPHIAKDTAARSTSLASHYVPDRSARWPPTRSSPAPTQALWRARWVILRCGHGLRLAVGELLVCPYCLAQRVATGLTVGFVGTPRL